VSKSFGKLYTWAYHKFYIDEVYMFITKQIIFKRISTPFAWFDKKVVDKTMDLVGDSVVVTSEKIKGLQSGRVQDYAMFFVSGVVVIAMLFWYYL